MDKKGGVPHISDMRIVLLGNRNAGKSSSGNTILGRKEFGTAGRTAECVKREGETAGRHITVVEAPGWWVNPTLEKTPERDKGEIVVSVSLCPPGPHALVLVIDVSDPFTERDRRAVQEHMELLGERVWGHTIVLFTRGDWLGDTSIEQHIESGGEALQWVVEKCGNRYHVVDNEKSDGGQVTELLDKIEEMVAGNRGHHVDFDAKIIKGLMKRKKEEKRRAEERKMKVKKQRETLRSSAGGVPHMSDMRIVLLGGRLQGKSSSGNTILGRQEFGTAGRTAECVKREGETAGRHITVVEAPGWWENYTVEKTPECDKGEIILCVCLCPPGPHALVLVINVSQTFTEKHRRAVQDHLELLGESVWNHTIVLFTFGDRLGNASIEQHIESGGEALQWVVEKCGNRYHVVDNEKSDGGQVTELLEKIEEMVAGNRGHHVDFDAKIINGLMNRKNEEKKKAEERKTKVKKQRDSLRSSAVGVPHISDMRIVLLGYRNAGKSSSGNTILGRQEFGTAGRTAECVKREGETAGRHITVVEAPGWCIDSTVELTPERDKGEIVLSVSLCPPGPHALVLVISGCESFSETQGRAVQEHMELLGKRVWSHTIVLFTRGDWLGDTSIEQHIESRGEALQWVVEKCGNRYHAVDNEKSDGGQVTELLEKIEEMVAGNRGHHIDFDAKIINGWMNRKKEEKRGAEERKMKVKKQRETLRSSAGGVPHISDLRIVLLGYRNAGKSSSGNTILGRQEFGTAGRTAECVKREGETAGRHITVVEAPGWWASYTVEETPERDKGEIVLSVSLCPPGPPALVLVIRVCESFTETFRRAVQEHMELLGERVWSHTILLFTIGGWLGDTSIEQHIESGGEALQWVVEKCGNRYHVVDNEKSDGGQVTELLEKIEEMVAGNRGHHVDFDAKIINGLMKRKKEEKRRAEERKMKVKKQRETLRSSAGGVPHISDMRIVLLGVRNAGKSSSGNTILGRQEFGTAGRTAECVKREGETAGRHITVVEAPGWRKKNTVEQTPECDKGEIILCVCLCPPGPHALVLVINVSQSFTETNRRAVQEHMELLGERVWSHTIVLFTNGDWLGDTSIEQHIESGGEALQWVVEKCGNRYHVVDNKKSDGGQVTELLDKIEEMVAGSSGEWSMHQPPICHGKVRIIEVQEADEENIISFEDVGGTQLLSASAPVVWCSMEEKMAQVFMPRSLPTTLGNLPSSRLASGPSSTPSNESTPPLASAASSSASNKSNTPPLASADSSFTPNVSPDSSLDDARRTFSRLSLLDAPSSLPPSHLEVTPSQLPPLDLSALLKALGATSSRVAPLPPIQVREAEEREDMESGMQSTEESDDDEMATVVVWSCDQELEEEDRSCDREVAEEELQKRTKKRKSFKNRRNIITGQKHSLAMDKKGGVPHMSDMRIVLLGNRNAGKSSSGNTILGRQEFGTAGRTAECVKREGETAGRHITVVEAPGWWVNPTLEKTPERDKGEIVLSVSLCPPGPHALLLVIDVSDLFTETDRRAVQEHMELLGERVWSHTILLFTYGDCLGDTSIEQHIESGGEALQWVVEKCGNRYHVVDNEKSDGGQVTELLEKIEEMVAGNRGHHVDFDAKIINGLMKRKKEEKRRAEERKMKVKKQRETLRSSAGETHFQSYSLLCDCVSL
ncbi:uncharacterized protein LOC134443095 [Engraulis encrasicolus]|uniref:uncharacterized protein LOC134443095 n=1 Tax=Engraulis encrasicolus TaxID=184585 RepID=UPI002FD58AC6